MIPIAFDEANAVFDHPDPDILPVNACITECEHGPVVITCWKLTIDELEEFKRTGRIYLYFYGQGMPVHSVSAINPFNKPTS